MKTFSSVRKRLSHRHFSVNFEKFLGKQFCRTPPSNNFSHDVVFFIFADQGDLQSKINSFGGAMVNQGKEFLCSYGNQVETSLLSCLHTCSHLGILIAGQIKKKEN